MNKKNQAQLSTYIGSVNKVLSEWEYLRYTGCYRDKVIEAEKYSVSAGGKRIRPVLCMAFYNLFGGEGDVSEIASCLELMHTFSLIHDDMPEMDNDSLRRGKPSTHAAYGADIALLAGDGLSILPFQIISENALDGKIDLKTAAQLTRILSEAAGHRGMIMGQMMDIYSEGRADEVSVEFLTEMSRLKTGCLLRASCLFGSILAGADDSALDNAAEYADNLGLAFQIVDDILDVTGDEKLLGKPTGSDLERNKPTFADILGIDKAKKLAASSTQRAISAISLYQGSEFLSELALGLVDRKI